MPKTPAAIWSNHALFSTLSRSAAAAPSSTAVRGRPSGACSSPGRMTLLQHVVAAGVHRSPSAAGRLLLLLLLQNCLIVALASAVAEPAELAADRIAAVAAAAIGVTAARGGPLHSHRDRSVTA